MEEIILEIRKIYDNNKELKKKVEKYESELKEFKNMTENLKNKNIEFEIKVKDLEEKNNFKSSKLIWENTQNIIKEKDNEIDKLKKNILYLERQNLIKFKQSVEQNINEQNINEQNINEENIKEENIKEENIKEEKKSVEKKSKKSKKKINIINVQNDIDDLEKDLLFIK